MGGLELRCGPDIRGIGDMLGIHRSAMRPLRLVEVAREISGTSGNRCFDAGMADADSGPLRVCGKGAAHRTRLVVAAVDSTPV